MEPLREGVTSLLGLDQDSLNVWQMALRAIFIYLLGIVLVRIGKKRFIGEFTAFDVILGFILGSLLANAITTAEAFGPKIAASFLIVSLHFLFSKIAFHSDRFGDLIKGTSQILVEDGEMKWDAMRDSHISEQDLLKSLRKNGSVDDPSKVKLARLERSGDISVILKDE